MERKEIEELIKFVKKTGVSEVSIEQEGFKITIKTHPFQSPSIQTAPPVNYVPAASVQSTAPAPQAGVAQKATADESKYITIKSPMIGTFYRSSSPEKPSFANVGDEI